MKKLILFSFIALCTSSLIAGNITGKVTVKGARHAGGAVIYIEKIEGTKFKAPEKHVVMNQLNLTFVPHILPVLAGTTVDFLNSDDVMHNVFSPEKCANKFNLGSWPKGKSRSFTFENPGCAPVLLCNVHPEMEAFVIVLQNPFYGVSDKKGNYIIKDVPPGKYTLKIWHEKLKGKAVEITIPETGDITQNFLIKR